MSDKIVRHFERQRLEAERAVFRRMSDELDASIRANRAAKTTPPSESDSIVSTVPTPVRSNGSAPTLGGVSTPAARRDGSHE